MHTPEGTTLVLVAREFFLTATVQLAMARQILASMMMLFAFTIGAASASANSSKPHILYIVSRLKCLFQWLCKLEYVHERISEF